MNLTPLRSVAIALIAIAATTIPSIAKPKATPTPSPTAVAPSIGGRQGPFTAEERLADLKKETNLTAAQEAKAKPIVEKYVSDRDAISNDTKLSKSEKNTKKDALRTAYNKDINAILTPDQQKKWAESKKEYFKKATTGSANASPSPSAKK